MKWTIALSIALVISIYSVAFADSILTLVAEPAHTVGPQSSSNPCIIAATTCKQDTSVFDYDNYTQKGSVPCYNEFSPTYTNAQILALFPTSPLTLRLMLIRRTMVRFWICLKYSLTVAILAVVPVLESITMTRTEILVPYRLTVTAMPTGLYALSISLV